MLLICILNYVNQSLSEHRHPDKVQKVHLLKAQIKGGEPLYIDPELATAEKEKGNAAFKNGKYPDAIKHYTEAIKRNPEAATLFSNRAIPD